MTLTKITPENMNDFPLGTVVLLRAGAYYPEVEGVVVGYDVKPATKYFPVTASLVVKTEDGATQYVTQLYNDHMKRGPIGTYLVKLAEKVAPKKKSPWAVE
jgi:hypothetical protein